MRRFCTLCLLLLLLGTQGVMPRHESGDDNGGDSASGDIGGDDGGDCTSGDGGEF